MVETVKGTVWFKQVFDEYYEFIRNYLFYLSADMELSEDLAQDVFMKMWQSKDKIKDETIKPFLFKIARNLFLNSHKRKKLDLKFINTRLENPASESPEFLLEMKEFDWRLQHAISNLPEQCRTYFLLNRIDDMKYKEIADSFGVSVKAVEKQISKALKILREKFDRKM